MFAVAKAVDDSQTDGGTLELSQRAFVFCARRLSVFCFVNALFSFCGL